MDFPSGRGGKGGGGSHFKDFPMLGRNFKGNSVELRGQPKIISSTISDEILEFLDICWVDPGSIWEYFGTILDHFWSISMVKNTTHQKTNFLTVSRSFFY